MPCYNVGNTVVETRAYSTYTFNKHKHIKTGTAGQVQNIENTLLKDNLNSVKKENSFKMNMLVKKKY